MPKPIFYTGSPLDRMDARRDDTDWIAALRGNPQSRVLPMWQNRNLIHVNAASTFCALSGTAGRDILDTAEQVVLLGLEGDTAYFAADISARDESGLDGLAPDAAFTDLRQVAATLAGRDGSILAQARGMLHWHRRHRFCGVCGSPTQSSAAGHVRHCTNPDCAQPHFPRTDPAVIMLVTRDGPDGECCLLGHKASFMPGMYSTLAGFVEPGESLEEAVAREVMEETGVAVTEVRYRASQPWPFPGQLMLGYRARATSEAITVNADELDDAFWFTRDDIARMGDTGKRLPRPDSIALWLVQEWLAEG